MATPDRSNVDSNIMPDDDGDPSFASSLERNSSVYIGREFEIRPQIPIKRGADDYKWRVA